MDIYRVTAQSPAWQRIAYDYVRMDAFVVGQGIPVEMEYNGDGSGEDLNAVILVDDHKPVAGLRIAYPEPGIGKIERVCVVRERQRGGLGHIIIEEAEKWIVEKGVHHVVISAQDRASGFYERVGYVVNPDADPNKYSHRRPRPKEEAPEFKGPRPNLGFKCVLMEKDL
ncbi:MAG: GNAT family N-acetyltransferase [Clostridia bacterium]|nr:GNAT family N-acetyltransferase [Clostridia bacterium]